MSSHPAKKICIATTIAPAADLSIQQQAVSSWLLQDFAVISVNTQEEIKYLQPAFPCVDFVVAARDARQDYGKPYIYLNELLSCLNKSTARICGIVNSDIYFDKPALFPFLEQHAANAFLFGSRVDVPSLQQREHGTWFRGYDYFFFDQRLIKLYPEENFCIGLPWWDYWIVLVPLALGVPIRKIVSPFAYHVVHSTNYSLEPWFALGYILGKYFRPSFALTTETMGLYNYIMYEHIDKHPNVVPLAFQ